MNAWWTEYESELLDREIEAERVRKPRPYADPELRRACNAIMRYKLKNPAVFKNIDRSVKGGAWLA